MNIIKNKAITKSELDTHCIKLFGTAMDHLTRNDASRLIEELLAHQHPSLPGSGTQNQPQYN